MKQEIYKTYRFDLGGIKDVLTILENNGSQETVKVSTLAKESRIDHYRLIDKCQIMIDRKNIRTPIQESRRLRAG